MKKVTDPNQVQILFLFAWAVIIIWVALTLVL
jgi:hypothetical protein